MHDSQRFSRWLVGAARPFTRSAHSSVSGLGNGRMCRSRCRDGTNRQPASTPLSLGHERTGLHLGVALDVVRRSPRTVARRPWAQLRWLTERRQTATNAIMTAWQCGGQGFDTPQLHHIVPVQTPDRRSSARAGVLVGRTCHETLPLRMVQTAPGDGARPLDRLVPQVP